MRVFSVHAFADLLDSLCPAIAQEKSEVQLREGIGKFDKSNLKHTQTAEKSVLPNSEGKWVKSALNEASYA